MGFKIAKETERPAIKMANFRLPESLLNELRDVSEKEGISLTELVKQMLRYCLDEYKKKK
jgi:metal-responsive CopG/Arc/MetJ family transcriptional regulator